MIGAIVTSVDAILLAQECRQMLVSASFFSCLARGWAGWIVEVGDLVEDHGRALGTGFFEFGGFDEDGAAQVADIVTAENEVLGYIEPSFED